MSTTRHLPVGRDSQRVAGQLAATIAAVPPASVAATAVDAAQVTILGVAIDRLDRRAARDAIGTMAARPGHEVLAFVNAHGLNLASRDARYRGALESASLVLNDGLGIALAAKLEAAPFLDNLNGSDLLPLLLQDFAVAGHRVFFYGAAPGVAARTADHWRRRIPALQVAGSLDGFTLSGAAAAEIVRESRADVVLVALGNPRQELWARNLGSRTGARLTIGVGAFFDFSAGVVRRAPRPVRALRLEWAFRLAQEPGRLAGRYLVGNPAFLARVALARIRPRPHTVQPLPAGALRHPSAARSVPFTATVAADPGLYRGPWPDARGHIEHAG